MGGNISDSYQMFSLLLQIKIYKVDLHMPMLIVFKEAMSHISNTTGF